MRLGGSLAGNLAGNFARAAGDGGPSLSPISGKVRHEWWPLPERVTLNGDGLSGLEEPFGNADCLQETASRQPEWSADGGPNGQPAVTYPDLGRGISSSGIGALAEDHRSEVYIVCALVDTFNRVPCRVVEGSNDQIRMAQGGSDPAIYRPVLRTSDAFAGYNIDTPAKDTGFHLHAFAPLAAGFLHQIDGVDVSPAISRTTGWAAWGATTNLEIGRVNSSEGGFAYCLITDPLTPTERAVVYDVMRARFFPGLP